MSISLHQFWARSFEALKCLQLKAVIVPYNLLTNLAKLEEFEYIYPSR